MSSTTAAAVPVTSMSSLFMLNVLAGVLHGLPGGLRFRNDQEQAMIFVYSFNMPNMTLMRQIGGMQVLAGFLAIILPEIGYPLLGIMSTLLFLLHWRRQGSLATALYYAVPLAIAAYGSWQNDFPLVLLPAASAIGAGYFTFLNRLYSKAAPAGGKAKAS